MLPTGNAKTALLPAILGDVDDAGGGGAPIERENEGETLRRTTSWPSKIQKRNDSEKGNSY